MKLGFIGCGNMASAIIKGLTAGKDADASSIYIYDVFETAAQNLADSCGVTAVASARQISESCDVIVLAVKPNVIEAVLQENAEAVMSAQGGNPLLISIAAGKTISYLEEHLGSADAKIVRVMPNINAKASAAMCGYCANKNVTPEDEEIVKNIFSTAGLVRKLDEKLFPVFSVIAGCGPAFAYMFIDAMARAGVKNGMKKEEALEIAAQTVLGSAKMILESSEHPWALIDQVCSPGGTTIEAVTSLQQDGMEAAVQNAVDKAVEKDKRL